MEMKFALLAEMSHEIRTPCASCLIEHTRTYTLSHVAVVNGVIGMCDLLLDGRLGKRQKDYVKTIFNSGKVCLCACV
jgi:hypothetical protein